ncbi:MAG: YdeI/OmpD-associated family protein [Cyclobacteriaceae bacterium]|nr:YdeI/OmpD-associated family protein [Cyclobacteriaceae bacterium]
MGKRDKRIDNYILKSADFAIPILTHLRELVHVACPEVVETMKWSFPVFEYKGILCNMASFKQHCAFGFWKATLMKDTTLMKNAASETAMGHLGKIQSLTDLPPDKTLIRFIKEAVKLNEAGAKVAKKSVEKKELIVPTYFQKALKADKLALKTFTNFSYSNQKEYVEWITEAKTEATREKRMATAIEWLAEGKVRNWKYIRK